ncbi:MAG: tRNA pseudouridine(55) synthase TruB, partial [bacterium]|nr:tRNA pseudouridine(55) synthase TruB [bacterium]
MSPSDGVAVIDKEAGWTSHDVVAKARGVFGTRKVGHAGTLDPDATGVLLLGVGRATRLLRFLSPLTKQYLGEMVLGAETSTLDASGDVTAVYDMSQVTPEEVADAAAGFVGEIMQVPPMVSAVRVGGRRLHELAREGLEVEREPRKVLVHELAVAPLDAGAGVYRMEVRCSSGTYIR